MGFNNIAEVYDRFHDQSLYDQWVDIVLESMIFPPQRAIDLGCGTGRLTQKIAPFCEEMIGLDLSSEMLEVAQRESSSPNITYVQGDMTDFQERYSGFDMITSFFDSLCFLSSEQQVEQVLHQVYQALNAQGMFLCDVITPNHVLQDYQDYVYTDWDSEVTLCWRSEVNPEQIAVAHYLRIFVEDALTERNTSTNASLYRGYETILHERTYPLQTYLTLLQSAGFALDDIQIFTENGEIIKPSEPFPRSERWFFRCIKNSR